MANVLKVVVGSHFFKISNLPQVFTHAVNQFARPFIEYQLVRQGKHFVKTPKRVYGAATADRLERRFHINSLAAFKQHMFVFGFTEDQVEFIYLEYKQPTEVTHAVQDWWEDRPHQVPAIAHLVDNSRNVTPLLGLQTGGGKANPLYTPVRIPGGWKPMGDIKVGDYAVDRSGNPTLVTAVHPQGVLDIYRIKFEDGRTVDCCDEHLWSITSAEKGKAWETVSTAHIRELLKHKERLVYIPLIEADAGCYTNLPIDPYELGKMIGSTTLGVDDSPYPEFDESLYLNAAADQRIELLKGIAHVASRVNSKRSLSIIAYNPVNTQFIIQLVRSLGGFVRAVKHHQTDTLYLNIQHPTPSKFTDNKYWLSRLRDNSIFYPKGLLIKSITYVGKHEAQCITVDNPEHLYVVDDYIVTHNSASAMRAIEEVGGIAVWMIRPSYIETWLKAIKKTMVVVNEDIFVVQGGDSLKALLNLAEDGPLPYKYIFVSNKTFQGYIKQYEAMGNSLKTTLGYACLPDEFYEHLGATWRIIDEVHQDYHLNFKLDMYTHVQASASLSATLESEDNFITQMHSLAYPHKLRYVPTDYQKYIDIRAVLYQFDKPHIIKHTTPRGEYNHNVFETTILKNKSLLLRYLTLLKQCIRGYYVENNRLPGDKLVIFCASIDFCTLLTKQIKEWWPDLSVARYVGGDPYSNLMDPDIRVTTIGSAGAAVDIPGLTRLLLTVSVSSVVANLQGIGRLRELPDGRTPVFYYMVAQNIPKQMEYHHKKIELTRSRSKSFGIEYARYVV
jgi:hypothetical protein